MLSIGDVATRAGVSVSTVRQWDRRGLLHARRTAGNQRRFDEQEVEQFLQSPEEAKGPRKNESSVSERSSRRSGSRAEPRREEDSVPPWERRKREAEADVDVMKSSHELEELDYDYRERRADRQMEIQRQEDALDRKGRVAYLRQKGMDYAHQKEQLASFIGLTGPEWSVLAARMLDRSVTEDQLPQCLKEADAERFLRAEVEKLWATERNKHHDEETKRHDERMNRIYELGAEREERVAEARREQAEAQRKQKVQSLISSASMRVKNELTPEGRRELDFFLEEAEIDADMSQGQVNDLVDETIAEWPEEPEENEENEE